MYAREGGLKVSDRDNAPQGSPMHGVHGPRADVVFSVLSEAEEYLPQAYLPGDDVFSGGKTVEDVVGDAGAAKVYVKELVEAAMVARVALLDLSDHAGDDPAFNEGGDAYEAIQRVEQALYGEGSR